MKILQNSDFTDFRTFITPKRGSMESWRICQNPWFNSKETVDDFKNVSPGQTGPVIFEKNDFIPVKYSKFEKTGLFCPGGTKKNCQPCSKLESEFKEEHGPG